MPNHADTIARLRGDYRCGAADCTEGCGDVAALLDFAEAAAGMIADGLMPAEIAPERYCEDCICGHCDCGHDDGHGKPHVEYWKGCDHCLCSEFTSPR